MKKNLYIQPKTESLNVLGEHLCDVIGVGSGGNPTDSHWGNAPARMVRGLKYL